MESAALQYSEYYLVTTILSGSRRIAKKSSSYHKMIAAFFLYITVISLTQSYRELNRKPIIQRESIMLIERFQIDNFSNNEHELLEYVINVANEFVPDIVIDETGSPYKVESQAPIIFKRRYNNGKLNVYFSYADYIKASSNNNESIIDIISALEFDPEKFWYLLLFISDYVSGSTLNTLQCNATPKQEIEQLIDFIEQNEEAVNRFNGVVAKQEMKLTLHIKGRTLNISNPNTLSAIATFCKQGLSVVEEDSLLNVGTTTKKDLTATKQIGLFAEMFRCFFNLYPQFTAKRKRGNNTTKSTLRLISKLAYLTKLTTNADYDSDDENLKGIIKLYHKQKTDTINTIYG
ncbi:MAG: hypothetical protein HDS77_01640 [Bacteroidales bacterium]|nr:hypothetical protein [Bacteroidales bacterium]